MAGGPLPQTCGDSIAPTAWIGPGRAGYLGPDLGVDTHAGSVGVLTVGLDAPLLLETPDHAPIRARSVFAPARAPHRVVAAEGRILLLFTDSAGLPAGRPAAPMRTWVGRYGLDHPWERELIAATRHASAPDPDILRRLAARTPDDLPQDPRIRRVTAEILEDPARSYRAEACARRLDLSTPHFLRLFAGNTGTTFRRYQQWNRLLAAARGIAAGHLLTRCATDAGFASPSHLSDTFHETLGTTASALLESRVRFEVGE